VTDFKKQKEMLQI